MKRRDAIKGLSLSAALGAYGYLGQHETEAQSVASNDRGESPIRITKVKPILTAPQSARLCVVKVETSEPGLYGLGCATFNQRILPVASAVKDYLIHFAGGVVLIKSRISGNTLTQVPTGVMGLS